MTCQEFITNLQGVNEGGDFSKDLLKVSIGVLAFRPTYVRINCKLTPIVA
jgi:hypothetical protein